MNYFKTIEKIENVLEYTKFCTLATSNKKGEICIDQMCLVNEGLKVYIQTDKTFEKVKNIKENPNVGINCGAYSFKGIAKIVGHPSTNLAFIKKIKDKHLSTYQQYTNLENEVLIEIELKECKIWGGDNSKDVQNQETILIVDLINKRLRTIICDKM